MESVTYRVLIPILLYLGNIDVLRSDSRTTLLSKLSDIDVISMKPTADWFRYYFTFQLSSLTLQVTESQYITAMSHRPFQVPLCWRLYRLEKWIFQMSPKLGREPVTSGVAEAAGGLFSFTQVYGKQSYR